MNESATVIEPRAATAGDCAHGGEGKARLPTGASYLESLRDGRVIFYEGRRVDDVTEHPAFRNAARSVARLYDGLHDPAQLDVLTCRTDTGSGGRTHRFFKAARSGEELVAARDAIAHWARMSYGWMGRTPDYKASLTLTGGARASYYGPYAENAKRWYRSAQERLPFLSHALANPPIDRHKDLAERRDVCVHASRETSEGIIVSGAKVVATAAPLTNYCFVGQTPGTVTDELDMSLSFIVPVNAPGVKWICRASYEHAAARHGSAFDAPLSSRFDENDAILTMQDVLIPWENVLIYRDSERVRGFFPETGFLNLFLFHGCTRLAVKLDFLAGLLARALKATGGMEARGKRALLGEVVAWSHTFWSLSNAMAHNPEPWGDDGALLPDRRAALAYCVLAPDCYPRLKDIIERTVASGLVYLPSSASDLASAEIEPLLRRYVRGSDGMDHRERIKVLKLLWDAVGSEFGGRHELYERNYAGGWECIRLMVGGDAQQRGDLDRMNDLVDRCLSEYDEEGWTEGPWSSGRAA